MFFKKKSRNIRKCQFCESEIEKKFSFCPYCGNDLIDQEKEAKDFGMLGKSDMEGNMLPSPMNMGITDKLLGSMVNTLIKTLDKQFRDMDKSEVRNFPNGISIKIGPSMQQVPSGAQKKSRSQAVKNTLSEEQLKRISELPKVQAKTSVKRLSDRIIYELAASGIKAPQDVIVSKLESGYEIKAIGGDKVYVNTLPVNLPMSGVAIGKENLLIEFKIG